jgi:pimeloyl-ACP methyl ester carboxylesterase
MVKAANWLTHLELDWHSPVWRYWLEGLGQTHTLIRYDERGCGLSDRDVADFSLDRWVEDLETVVDAARVERFALLGVSQGAPARRSTAASSGSSFSTPPAQAGTLREGPGAQQASRCLPGHRCPPGSTVRR